MSETRIGRVSAIDYECGKISVVYTDKNNTVSKYLSCLAIEYNMPAIGSLVVVQTIDNCSDGTGIILGKIWNKENKPKEGYEGLYRKDLSNNCFVKYDDNTKKLLIQSQGDIEIKGTTVTVTQMKKDNT